MMTTNFSQTTRSILGALAAVLLIAGCADLSIPQLAAVKSVLVSPDTVALRVGDTVRVKAAPLDSLSTLESQRLVTWTSSASGVATVDTGGLVHAVAPGTTTIGAAVGTVSGHSVIIVTGAPATLTITGGNTQSAAVNSAVAAAPTVEVLDAQSNPVANVTVTFAVTGNGGQVNPPTAVTGFDGKASTAWTLGPFHGADSMTATIAGSGVTGNPAVFTATGTVGAPSASMSTVTASPSAIAPSSGSSIATITVTVRDSAGSTISGATVTLTATGTGNTLSQPPDTTDTGGQATGAISSTFAEGKVITAKVNGTVILVQKDTVNVSNATATQIGVSTHTVAVANASFSTQPTVDIRDGFGNRVPGATNPVTVTLISGNGTLSGSPTTVNAVAGRATFSGLLIKGTRVSTDTLGAGMQILQFSSPGFTSVTDTVQVGVSFSYNIADIVTRNCNTCHSFNYGTLVNASTTGGFSCPGLVRIVANDTLNSFAYAKIKTATPSCGAVMPTSGLMSANQIHLVRDWILQGAPNN
ncbi:MAG TPA: Ig-like domain-containing protein [Gemmatimonadales bacterium]|jgi:hypothetical protein